MGGVAAPLAVAFFASSAIIGFTVSIASATSPHRAVLPVPFHSVLQRNATQRTAAQSNGTQGNATLCNAAQRNTMQQDAMQRNAAQRYAAKRSAAQRSATQRNAMQDNATHLEHSVCTDWGWGEAGGGWRLTSCRYALWIHSVPCGCPLWAWRGQWAGGRSQSSLLSLVHHRHLQALAASAR